MSEPTYVNARGNTLSKSSSPISISRNIWAANPGQTTSAVGGGHTLYADGLDDNFVIFSPTDKIVLLLNHKDYTVTDSAWDAAYILPNGIQNLVVNGNMQVATGNTADNLILTGTGSATVSGGGGDDIFVVGAGANTIVVPQDSGCDVIYAFKHQVDHVRLDGNTRFPSWASIRTALKQVAGDVQFNMGHGQTLTFRDNQLSSFSASDFYLPINTAKLTLTFDDEFNSFMSSPDGSKGWMTSWPYGGINDRALPSNGDAAYYSDASVGVNPFSINNGILNLTDTVALPGSNPLSMPYDAGVMTTYKSLMQLYGYFEIRTKMPSGSGLWPSFYMMSADNTAELDIFEVLGISPTTLHATATQHIIGGASISTTKSIIVPDTSASFHTYGVNWEPATVTFYMDGNVIATAATPASMNKPMYMIIGMGVGTSGSWVGAPNASTAFPATLQVDYVRAYATAATISVSGSASASGSAPIPLSVQTLDTIKLSLAEDAYFGDARAIVTVDGKTAGGMVTVSASHALGQTQAVTLTGQWAPGAHDIGVQFINDAYGGTPTTDRNLYVMGTSFDGQASATAPATLWTSGTVHIATAASPLVLQLSEDAYLGDAQFTVAVDGKALGAAQSVTTLHASGAAQNFGFGQAMTAGMHDVAVSFLNDAWGGTAATDRNLYVNAIDVDGAVIAGSATVLLATSTQHFSVVVAPPI